MPTAQHRLSVIIPCFNEIDTIAAILCKTAASLPQVRKEIVIVDDCSSDGSRQWIEWLSQLTPQDLATTLKLDAHPDHPDVLLPEIKAVLHQSNGGKGTAIRSGLLACSGDVIVVQDADLEYDPADWHEMFGLIEDGIADVVYGSRFYGRPHRSLNYHHYLGNRIISLTFNVLYNQILTDIETCYKMFRRETVEGIDFVSKDFGIEVELSAALVLARRWRIYEMGIRYFGRTYTEGKKIGWRDGVLALWYLVRFRFKSYAPKDDIDPWEGPDRRAGYTALRQSTNAQPSTKKAPSALAGGDNQGRPERERVDGVD